MEASVARKSNGASPSYGDVLRATNEVLALVEAEADEGERSSHLTDRLVAEFRRRGLYTLLTPKTLGGLQLPFVEAMELVERVSWADGSAGWCMMVQGVMGGSLGSFLPEEGARTVYGKGADVTCAGHGVPRGYARPVDGGYFIKGLWGYGSSIYHAEWIHSGCFLTDGDNLKLNPDGAPEIILAHHPRDTIELKGNWDVLGLRATGSFDYTLKEKELFVPSHMCYRFDDRVPRRGGIQYSTGLIGLTSWGHTGWALGVGRRTLDELAKLARSRSDFFGKMSDSASFKQSFADAEAKYRAARAFVYGAWDDLCDSFAHERPATVQQIALIRLAMRHLHNVISETATFAHRSSRGVSLRPSLLQRCYRDIHSGTQHILLADEIMQECGKVLLGVTGESAEWTMFGVKG